MRRVDIKTGFNCNNNCIFCAQGHKKQLGNRSTEEIKNALKEARRTCSGVVFTGGEPTIREDILELVAYAKQLGFELIQIQSNSRMLSYMNFCKAIVRAGANEFSPALHGHNARLHERLTRAEGSYGQTVKAIKNLRELKQRVISNTVVVKDNLKYLPEIARLLVKLDVDQFQFAFVHPVGSAYKHYDKVVPNIKEASEYIKKGLDMGIMAGKKVMAEAMPFCLMQGYEQYVAENFIPATEIRDLNYINRDFTATRRTRGKKKFEKCRTCRYDNICEGPWKEYPERFGSKDFVPVKGKKLKSTSELF